MEESKKPRIAVMGGGSWATAIAKFYWNVSLKLLGTCVVRIKLTNLSAKSRNPSYLSGIVFDTSRIVFTSKINQVVKNSDILILLHLHLF